MCEYNGWSNRETWLVNVWYNPETVSDVEYAEQDLEDKVEALGSGPLQDMIDLSLINWDELKESMDEEEPEEEEPEDEGEGENFFREFDVIHYDDEEDDDKNKRYHYMVICHGWLVECFYSKSPALGTHAFNTVKGYRSRIFKLN